MLTPTEGIVLLPGLRKPEIIGIEKESFGALMNRIYQAIIRSTEFICEARKVPVGCDAREHRRRMIANLNMHTVQLVIAPDVDDLVLQDNLIDGNFDQEGIAERITSQLIGRDARAR